MALKNERSWKVLVQGMLGTIAIWTLSNFGVILLSVLLTGTVDYITAAFFWSGLYGCASTCAIYVIREKLGYLGADELASVQKTREEVDQAVFDSTKQTEASKEHKQYVEDVAKGKTPDRDKETEITDQPQETMVAVNRAGNLIIITESQINPATDIVMAKQEKPPAPTAEPVVIAEVSGKIPCSRSRPTVPARRRCSTASRRWRRSTAESPSRQFQPASPPASRCRSPRSGPLQPHRQTSRPQLAHSSNQ